MSESIEYFKICPRVESCLGVWFNAVRHPGFWSTRSHAIKVVRRYRRLFRNEARMWHSPGRGGILTCDPDIEVDPPDGLPLYG
jgi:hypothetical protein